MIVTFTAIQWYHRSSNRSNGLSFFNEYSIIVHNKTILKTVEMKAIFDEILYIVAYFIMNIFYFLVVFYWEKTKKIIILNIMTTYNITICIAQLSLSTEHARQNRTMWSNIFYVIVFPKRSIIVSLYDYTNWICQASYLPSNQWL